MPFTAIANGGKVVETFFFDGDFYAQLTWGILLTTDLDLTLATEVNNQFSDFYNGTYGTGTFKSGMSDNVSLVRREITDVRTETGPQFVFSPAIVGTGTTDPLPHGTCLKMNLYGSLRGRSYRGSKFFPGITESNSNASGQPDSVLLSNTILALEDLLIDLVTAGAPLAILSRADGAAHVVESFGGSTRWHYQRRRQRA